MVLIRRYGLFTRFVKAGGETGREMMVWRRRVLCVMSV